MRYRWFKVSKNLNPPLIKVNLFNKCPLKYTDESPDNKDNPGRTNKHPIPNQMKKCFPPIDVRFFPFRGY